MPILAPDWMPAVPMSRIHLHWSAGQHQANDHDRRSYHILVQGDGSLIRGDRSIAANAPGSGMTPASHTLNANTGAIGVSLCCMVGAKEIPFDAGAAPMTRVQWDKGIAVIAELSRRYGVAITPRTILTHAEVHPNLNIPQKNKWDITRLAFDAGTKGYKDVGDRMRREVAVLLDAFQGPTDAPPSSPSLKLPRFKVQGVLPSTLNLRNAPAGEKVGVLSEGTRVERLVVSGDWWQVRTSGGYVGWVWSSYLVAV